MNFEFADRGGLKALLAPLSAIIHHRGSRLMLSVAVIYSVTSVFGKGALQYAPGASFGPFYFALLGLISAGLFASSNRGNLSVLWRKPLPPYCDRLRDGASVVTHFLALERIEVAYMIAVKRTSLLFGILYGALLFHEQRLTRHSKLLVVRSRCRGRGLRAASGGPRKRGEQHRK